METAKIVTTLLLNLALFLPCLPAANPWHLPFLPNPSMCKCEGPIPHVYSYTRFADVERRCQSVLSSAAELKAADADRDGDNLMYQLSFMNGDWSQDAGEAPLFPFRGSYAGPEVLEAVPLASFSLRHMDMAQRPGPRTAFNASGVLSLAISCNSSCSSYDYDYESHMGMEPPRPVPEFDLRRGIAKLKILFQGVYTETSDDDGGGGERVLCMVGDAVLPVRSSNSTDPWDWAKNRDGGSSSDLEPPPVVSDGDILLVLRYPKTPTLTSRAVHGVMTSTKAKSDGGAYFDTVRLVSQPSGGGYRFRQEDTELDAAASDEHPAPFHEGDALEMEHHRRLNRGASPCDMIYQSIPSNQVMEVIPNWNCKGTDEFCNRLGPFVSSRRPATATNAAEDEGMAFTRSAIVVSGLQCKPIDGTAATRVAAVFRYVPPWEQQSMAAKRTGLSGMTLSAEGVWIPSTGRTHMVACLGVGGKEEACRYRVTLSVQTTLSMARRGSVAGQITAMDDGGSHPPLLFQQRLFGRFTDYGTSRWRMSYIYTKVDQARQLLRLRASEPTGFRDSFVGKSLLSYPSVDAGAAIADIGSLSNLAHELDLNYRCMGKPPPFVPEWIDGPFFELQILSAGTLVGRSYSTQFQQRRSRMRIMVELFKSVVHGEERQQILNVSAELMAYGNCLGPSPVMSLEGVYNAEDGRMYLIGCRTVHAARRRVLSMSEDLEEGMDCSIEVMVEYPPTTARRLMISWPAKVFVTSTRDDGDPLHFNRTELHMLPIIHRQRRLVELAVPIMEAFLSFIVLLATIWVATWTSP